MLELKKLDLSSKKSLYLSKYRDFLELPIHFSFYMAPLIKESKWSILNVNENLSASALVNFFTKIESKTLKELMRDNNQFAEYELSKKVNPSPCFEDLLETLKKQNIDINNLYRIKYDKTKRLWGIFENSVFYILIWDEYHALYPTRNVYALCPELGCLACAPHLQNLKR